MMQGTRRRLTPDDGGGKWEYYQLSIRGFNIAPAGQGLCAIDYEGIGFTGTVSAQEAGIIGAL